MAVNSSRIMTDGEIYKSFRLSGGKKSQIEILAQLNNCKTTDIARIIRRMEKETNKKDRAYRALLEKARPNTPSQLTQGSIGRIKYASV